MKYNNESIVVKLIITTKMKINMNNNNILKIILIIQFHTINIIIDY